jgi:ribosome biogenesis GTPase
MMRELAMAEPTNDSLATLGWRGFFAAQIDPILEAELAPVRVTGVHRDTLLVAGLGADDRLPVPRADNEEAAATVGDWLLVDPSAHSVRRRLDRFGLFKRRAAGTDRRLQLIAANVDTLFIVTSANRDFNPARLERYLALALEGSANPVVIVTKADLNEEARDLAARAARLAPGLFAECLDARDPIAAEALGPWCATGQTVALVGSSGVGKSTLINTLTGAGQMVNAVREADQRGRHSTTARSMHRLTGGGWLIDTPGMRELKLVDATDSIDDVFAEITELATRCRFTDCEHNSEPGCAIRKALKSGALDVGRLERFRKLSAETRYNSESLAERRARFKSFGKLYKSVQKDKSARRRES